MFNMITSAFSHNVIVYKPVLYGAVDRLYYNYEAKQFTTTRGRMCFIRSENIIISSSAELSPSQWFLNLMLNQAICSSKLRKNQIKIIDPIS